MHFKGGIVLQNNAMSFKIFILGIQKSMESTVIVEAILIERDQYGNKKSVLSEINSVWRQTTIVSVGLYLHLVVIVWSAAKSNDILIWLNLRQLSSKSLGLCQCVVNCIKKHISVVFVTNIVFSQSLGAQCGVNLEIHVHTIWIHSGLIVYGID